MVSFSISCALKLFLKTISLFKVETLVGVHVYAFLYGKGKLFLIFKLVLFFFSKFVVLLLFFSYIFCIYCNNHWIKLENFCFVFFICLFFVLLNLFIQHSLLLILKFSLRFSLCCFWFFLGLDNIKHLFFALVYTI